METAFKQDVAARRAAGTAMGKNMKQEVYWANIMQHMRQQTEGSQKEKFEAALTAWRSGERLA